MTKRFVWRGGQFVDAATGEPMLSQEERNGPVKSPMVMVVNFEPYRSVVHGQIVDGQRSRREELAIAADRQLVPFERIDGRPGGLINEAFARRGGQKTSEAAKEWAANKRKSTAVKRDKSGAIWTE